MINEFVPEMDDLDIFGEDDGAPDPDVSAPAMKNPFGGQPKEEEEIEEEAEEDDDAPAGEDNPFVKRVNDLYAEGLLSLTEDELPEVLGDYSEFGASEQEKILIASLRKSLESQNSIAEEARKEGMGQLLESLDPITKKGVEYSLSNPDAEDLKDFYKGLIYEADIKSLNPQDASDAERILKIYYKEQNFKQEDIEEKITDLKSLNKLIKEATLVKPKLDAQAEAIADRKLDEQKAIVDYESSKKHDLMLRINEILKVGNLDGIPITRETGDFLVSALAGDEFQIPIKGKTVELNLAEAMILHHKHSKKGDLKLLMKALILLHKPEEFEKFYTKKVVSTETNRFIKEHRISSGSKTAAFSLPATKKPIERIPIILT